MKLVISIKRSKKGRHKDNFVVNIKEEGKGASGGFIKYYGIYNDIEFNDNVWNAEGNKGG